MVLKPVYYVILYIGTNRMLKDFTPLIMSVVNYSEHLRYDAVHQNHQFVTFNVIVCPTLIIVNIKALIVAPR